MFSWIEKCGITYSISSHCWDSCHNFILKQTRNHLTQCFSIFFSAQHTWRIQYNVSNSGSLDQGFSVEGRWADISAFPAGSQWCKLSPRKRVHNPPAHLCVKFTQLPHTKPKIPVVERGYPLRTFHFLYPKLSPRNKCSGEKQSFL